MRSMVLVRSTIHTRAVLLSIDQYVDMHKHFHNNCHPYNTRIGSGYFHMKDYLSDDGASKTDVRMIM